MAIGFVLEYAYNIINGEGVTDSLKSAIVSGFKTGGGVFATYVVSSQLAKTSGTDTATLTTAQLTIKAATALKNQAIFTVVTVAVLDSGDSLY